MENKLTTSIYKKLLEVQKEIEVMPKEGRNTFNNYNYLMEAQVTTRIKELFDKHGLFFHYQSEIMDTKEYEGAKGDTQFLVTVKVMYSFCDTASGERLEGVACGQGADKGDKGVYKAITGAIKYIYMKTFNIPTGDDAEKDSPELKSKIFNTPNNATAKVPTCSICKKPMKATKPGSKTPFYCKHEGGVWGQPVYQDRPMTANEQEFVSELENEWGGESIQ